MNLDETAKTDWALHDPPHIHKRNNQLVIPLAAVLTVMADENSVKLVQLCTRVCSCVLNLVRTTTPYSCRSYRSTAVYTMYTKLDLLCTW